MILIFSPFLPPHSLILNVISLQQATPESLILDLSSPFDSSYSDSSLDTSWYPKVYLSPYPHKSFYSLTLRSLRPRKSWDLRRTVMVNVVRHIFEVQGQ